jgi:chemotaxis protein methyltransferase CheR
MELKDQDFYRLRDYMYNTFGINLAQKRVLIESRLSLIVQQKGFNDFTDYIDHIMADASGKEISTLVSKLTTNFTYFMREEQHFEFLKKTALPEIMPRIRDNSLAIWSAGCSSGEEPYTIAMVLDDYFKTAPTLNKQLLATDISANVLNAAAEGVYPLDRMNKLPEQWVKKYFVKVKENAYQIGPSIKNEVIFKSFNLMETNFAFRRKFHIIFCRNVMIYFDAKTRESLACRFYDALENGGYLIIGMSETLLNSKTNFKYVSPSIYKKA